MMPDWLRALLRPTGIDSTAAAEPVEPRLLDADGRQLVPTVAPMHDELEWLERSSIDASADLDLASTEHRRGLRARLRKNRRKP